MPQEDINYMKLVDDFHRTMMEYNLNLVYEGEVDQSITKAFTALAEKNLSENNADKSTVRKVYHVMVECLQNIYKHADGVPANDEKKSQGIFIVGHDEGGYVVCTGNPIANDKVEGIKNMLDKINGLEPEEVKSLYKTQIREGVLSEKGGAGLGFIDISRKTGSKLEYKFETIDEISSFFILKTYIAK